MVEHFTRDTWRKGKRRATYQRVKPWGGATQANANFLASIALHAIGGPLDTRTRCSGRRRNGEPCHCLAMRGSRFCQRHGGAQGARHLRSYVARWQHPDRKPSP
jgi:hypothetical protein